MNTWLDDFYHDVTGPYWDAERRHVDAAYRTLPFPLAELPAPGFRMPYRWSRAHFLGYLSTWSAVQHYQKSVGDDPVTTHAPGLEELWPADEERSLWFPVFMRIGRFA